MAIGADTNAAGYGGVFKQLRIDLRLCSCHGGRWQNQSKFWLFAGINWENYLSGTQNAFLLLWPGKDGTVMQVVAICDESVYLRRMRLNCVFD